MLTSYILQNANRCIKILDWVYQRPLSFKIILNFGGEFYGLEAAGRSSLNPDMFNVDFYSFKDYKKLLMTPKLLTCFIEVLDYT